MGLWQRTLLIPLAAALLMACAGDGPPSSTPTPAGPSPSAAATPAPPDSYAVYVSLAEGPFTAGKAYPFSVQVVGERSGDVTEDAQVRVSVAPNGGVTLTEREVLFEVVGAYTVTVEASIKGEALSEILPRQVSAGPPTQLALSLSTATPRAGQTLTVSGELQDAYGNLAIASPQLSVSTQPDEGVVVDGDAIIGTVAGAYTVMASNPVTGLSAEASFEIIPGSTVNLALSLSEDRLQPGSALTATAVTTDAYGNVTDSDPALSAEPSEGVRIAGQRVILSEEGVYDIRARWEAEDRDLAATAGPVTVDGTAPTLTLTSPQRAAWTDAATITIAGTASDALAGLAEVRVGGESIPGLVQGSFSIPYRTLPGLNVLEIEATDLNGNTKSVVQTLIFAAEAAPQGERVEDAFYGRMGTETIDELALLLEAELDPVEIGEWATSYNPIEAYYDAYTGPLGNQIVTSAYINIDELRYTTADVRLVPHGDGGNGYLDLEVVFDKLGLTLTAYGELANIDYELCGNLDTTEAVAVGRAKATFNNQGVAHATMSQVSVSLKGFDMQMCDDSLDNLMDIIEEETQQELEQMLTELIIEDIPAELETLLNSLTISETFEFEGAEMVLNSALEGMAFDDAGATLWMWSELSTTAMDGIPDNPGSPLTPSIPPSYSPDYTLYVSANDDLLNQLLYTMWVAGTLHLNYSAEDLGLTPEQVGLLFNGATTALFTLEPALPPVLTSSFTLGYLMDAGLGDCYINVFTDASTGDPENLALDYRLVATLLAPADAEAPSPSVLRILFGSPTTLHVEILEARGDLALSEEGLNLVLDAAADELISFLNDSLGEIPIPTVEGYSLYAYDFFMDGPSADYLTIAGDLVPPP